MPALEKHNSTLGGQGHPVLLTEVTAHVIKSELSRDCPLGVNPGPPGPRFQLLSTFGN